MGRKLYTSLGVVATVGVPSAAVISCVEDDNNLKNPVTKKGIEDKTGKPIIYNYEPFDYNNMDEIGKEQPIFSRGIMNGSLNQGISFLLNIAKELGFDINQDVTKTETDIEYSETGKEELKEFKKEAVSLYGKLKKGMKWLRPKRKPESSAMFIDSLGTEGFYVNAWTFNSSGISIHGVYDSDNQTGKAGIFNTPGDNPIKFKISNYIQYIDANNPGTINTLMYFKSNVYHAYNFALNAKSRENFYQQFRKITDEVNLMDFKELIYNSIVKLQYNMRHRTDESSSLLSLASSMGFLSPVINKFLHFINDIEDIKSMKQKIYEIIGKLNNGSHNIFAIEIFARGMKNIPPRYMAYHGTIPKTKFQGTNLISEAVGVVNSKEILGMIEWFFPTWKQGNFKKKNNSYKNLDFTDKIGNKDGIGARWNKENYDPDIMSGTSRIFPEKNLSHSRVMGKILDMVRKGRIIPLSKPFVETEFKIKIKE